MSATQLESFFVKNSSHKIHYHVTGSGAPVVLIHGGGPGAFGYSNFRQNIGPMSERNRVIVVDLPGYGESDPASATESLLGPLAESVRLVLDDLGVEKASLVGNSLGGGTALRLALDHPQRVHKLVLMGSAGSVPMTTPFPTEGLHRMLSFYEGEGPTAAKMRGVLDLLVYDNSSVTDALVEERLAAASKPHLMAKSPLRNRAPNPRDELWREGLSRLDHETLILWGRDDRVMPLDASFLLLKLIPNAHLHVFPKCGHWVQLERAPEFNILVDSFINH